MHAPETLKADAEALVRNHFGLLNARDLAAAKQQLFWPAGTSEKPIDVYLETMADLGPFEIRSLEAVDFQDVRQKRHGAVATISVRASVRCSLGERTTEVGVWWWPDTNRLAISSRPSDWVLERIRAADHGHEEEP
jgi:hypothetical protein